MDLWLYNLWVIDFDAEAEASSQEPAGWLHIEMWGSRMGWMVSFEPHELVETRWTVVICFDIFNLSLSNIAPVNC